MFNIQVVFHDGGSQTFVQENPLTSCLYDHHYLFKPMLDKNGDRYWGVSIPFTSVRMVFTTEVVDQQAFSTNSMDISSAPVEQHRAPDVVGREPDLC
jgi:hypothetical protein